MKAPKAVICFPSSNKEITWKNWQVEHSVEKELAGWSRSKSCGQQLDVQVETSDVWYPSGVQIGTSII